MTIAKNAKQFQSLPVNQISGNRFCNRNTNYLQKNLDQLSENYLLYCGSAKEQKMNNIQ